MTSAAAQPVDGDRRALRRGATAGSTSTGIRTSRVAEWWEHRGEGGLDGAALPAGEGGRGLLAAIGRRRPRPTFTEPAPCVRPGGLGLLMAAPTILTHGTPEQIERLVPPMCTTGAVGWCQLFSEPGIRVGPGRAHAREPTRDGDHWIITGQKVWSSHGHARPTTGCCWPAPTSTCPSTPGSRGSPSRSTSPG